MIGLKKIIIIDTFKIFGNKRNKVTDNKFLSDGDGLTLWATHTK